MWRGRCIGRSEQSIFATGGRRRRRFCSAGCSRLITFSIIATGVAGHGGEKVAALTAAGVPEAVLPRRVYPGQGNGKGQTRYFVNKLRSRSMRHTGCSSSSRERTTHPSALETWGESHAAVWGALRAAGRAITVVVVGRDRGPLDDAEKVLARWAAARPVGARSADDEAELDTLRAAVSETNAAELQRLGGLPTALRRIVELEGPDDGAAAGGGERLRGAHFNRLDLALGEGTGVTVALVVVALGAVWWWWVPFLRRMRIRSWV